MLLLYTEYGVYPVFFNNSVVVSFFVCGQVRAKLRRGELVLVLGASGGVGLAAVQLAKVHGSIIGRYKNEDGTGVGRYR